MIKLSLRPARTDDVKQLFEWVNSHDALQQKQLTHSAIPWTEHLAWMKARLGDPACRIAILEVNGEAAGQIRLWGKPSEPAVDIYVAARWRHHRLAKKALILAVRSWRKEFGAGTVKAIVKVENAASYSFFKKLGFVELGENAGFVHLELPSSTNFEETIS